MMTRDKDQTQAPDVLAGAVIQLIPGPRDPDAGNWDGPFPPIGWVRPDLPTEVCLDRAEESLRAVGAEVNHWHWGTPALGGHAAYVVDSGYPGLEDLKASCGKKVVELRRERGHTSLGDQVVCRDDPDAANRIVEEVRLIISKRLGELLNLVFLISSS